MKRLAGAFIALTFLLTTASPLFADASGDMMSMLQSMKEQMAKMQATIDAQNSRIQQLESTKSVPQTSTPTPSGDYQPKLTEKDWQSGISDNLGKSVPWIKGLKFTGDFRLRYESFLFDKNYSDGAASKGLDEDYNRFRVRLRFGFEKDYGDDWKMGFRVVTGAQGATTGQNSDQTSTNQTLGQYWAYKDIFIDRAYAQYSPNSMKDYGPIKGVTIGAGKFENPFLRYSTTLVWDPDVTPEGAYEKVNFQAINTEDTKVNFYTTLGQTIVNDNNVQQLNFNNTNSNMFGYQEAINVATYAFGTDQPVEFTSAFSFYDYTNWSETVASNGSGTSFLRTNDAFAEKMRVFDFYPELLFYVNNTPITLFYDYAKNVADDGSGDPPGVTFDRTVGWGLGGKVGKNTTKGTWEAYASYYQVGADAVPAAFNDSDFGGPGEKGYTNRKGYKFGLGYMLTDSLQLYWTTYFVSPLDVTLLDANSVNESVFRSQLDAVYKF